MKDVKVTRLGAASYVAPDFPLVADQLAMFLETIERVRATSNQQIVIDLEHVPVLDSRGLECLVELGEELRGRGGSLRLAGGGPLCREILAVTRIAEVIPVYDDLEAAARSFR